MPEAIEASTTRGSSSDDSPGDSLADGHPAEADPGPDPVKGSGQGSEPGDDSEQASGSPPGSDHEPGSGSDNGMDGYHRLQRRLILATLAATALAVPVTALCFDLPTAGSLLIGALAGLLYIRLLARSVSRLGGDRRSVGKFQLVVPVVLVLAAARIPQLEIVPALVGFLLYKPALIVQAVLDS